MKDATAGRSRKYMLQGRRIGMNARTKDMPRNGGRPSGQNVRHGSFNEKGESIMKQASFMAICVYYYTKELLRYLAYAFCTVCVLFVIHKLVSWALWVMSL